MQLEAGVGVGKVVNAPDRQTFDQWEVLPLFPQWTVLR